MKQKRPVLYELMRDHRGSGSTGGGGGGTTTNGRIREFIESPIADAEIEVKQSHGWLASGAPVRIPIGYLLLGVAAILVLGLGAFLIGHSRGQSNDETNQPNDTALLDQATDPGDTNNNLETPLDDTPRTDQARSQTTRETPTRTPGPIESNPRTPGLNYFVIVQTSRSNALRVAEFCRERGLEAYVDRVNNADFRVFLLPGFTAEEVSSTPVRNFERRIEEVKQAWNEEVGRTDLGQHIAVKYRD